MTIGTSIAAAGAKMRTVVRRERPAVSGVGSGRRRGPCCIVVTIITSQSATIPGGGSIGAGIDVMTVGGETCTGQVITGGRRVRDVGEVNDTADTVAPGKGVMEIQTAVVAVTGNTGGTTIDQLGCICVVHSMRTRNQC